MSDEATQEPEIEIEAPEIETETQEQPEVVEQPFRAWELKPKESAAKHVPYDRFSEVLSERDLHAKRSQELEAEIAKIRTQATSRKSVEAIRIEDFTDPVDYIQALTDAKVEARIEQERDQIRQEREKEQRAREFEVEKETYQRNLLESFKRNPEYQQAAAAIDQYSAYIHPQIARELIKDENVGELFHKIATDKDLFNEMFSGNPEDFIRKIHKISARITREEPTESELIPARTKDVVRQTIPTPVRPVSGKPTRDPEKMSLAEYRKYVANGYK